MTRILQTQYRTHTIKVRARIMLMIRPLLKELHLSRAVIVRIQR